MEKNTAWEGKVVRKVLTGKVTFDQKPEGRETRGCWE